VAWLFSKSTLNYQIRDDLNIFVPACENLWIEINQPDKGHRHWCSLQHDYNEFQEAFQENILKRNKQTKCFMLAVTIT